MFVLDTNILSTMMRPERTPRAAAWIGRQPLALLFTTSVCEAEILSGIAVLPHGRRRSEFEAAARAIFAEDFEGRVLPFDGEAATAYADIFAARRQAGRPIATVDLMIAAIARSQGATVVTRDVKGFEGCGLALINPWETA
jgi:toxin FitB